MRNNNNRQYSSNIKREPESYNFKRELPLNEEDKKNDEPSKIKKKYANNNFNNKNNNNYNYNNQNNKFIGIKREKREDNDSYSPNSRNNNYNSNHKGFNQNNNFNNRNNSQNHFNNQYNNNHYNNNNYKKIKKENNAQYQFSNPPRNNFNYNNNNNFNMPKNNNNNYNYNNYPSKSFQNKNELPIYYVKDDIYRELSKNSVIIISGKTGCGKSTQVPQYIYGLNPNNKILMTQPRRIAAVSIAKRLAVEMKEKLGKKIGYHVSMNPRISAETKIFVKTTGIFMEELIHKNLEYTHIIIDEVHERDIYVDLVLALIVYYFEKNPKSKIKVILMSATIAEDKFAKYLEDINKGKVPIIRVQESDNDKKITEYNLEGILNNIKNDEKISEDLRREVESVSQICLSQVKPVPVFMDELFPVVACIIEKIENENNYNSNGVLIFVPGLGEIQELQSYLSRYFLNKTTLEFLILHSQISDDEQDLVFKYTEGKRKIILATNIAESSITISNIDFVIDFCLVKQTRYDEYQNTSILELKWCSKASVFQRKGRTGRINKGYYFRLITNKLYNKLDEYPKAEILRTPLETPILKLKIYEPEKEPQEILMKTIEPPEEEKIINTLFRLEKMGALIQGHFPDKGKGIFNNNNKKIITNNLNVTTTKEIQNKINYKSGIITKVGRIFAELPIDIKYSRLIMIAYALGEIDLGITLAAIISQDKSMFLSSDKCNRFNIYNSKNYYCFQK